ncbi:MAG: hypothetical protein ACR2QM_08305, partial [Longimicrobiales bacterium]
MIFKKLGSRMGGTIAAMSLAAGCGGGSPTVEPPVAPAAGERVYVASQASASVAVIDVVSGQVVETVDVTQFGFDENSRPHHTATGQDGSW